VLVALTGQAAAQSRTAEAEQLFRDGKRLMKEGNTAAACGAFAASLELEPAVSTKLNLADCREKNGQLATAWGLFVDVERATRGDAQQAGVYRAAKARAAALETRLSYLTISVPDESRVDGLVVTRNGEVVEEGLWNRALPSDGGDVVVAGRAPGHEEWSTTVTVPAEAGKVSVEVPRFKELKQIVTEPEPGQPGAEAGVGGGAPVDAPGPARGRSSRRWYALAVGGVGVGGLIAGGVLGLQARGLEDEAYELCPSNPCARADEANAKVDRAEQRALYSNIALGVGVAALAGAAILYFTGGGDETPPRTLSAWAAPDQAGIAVLGRF
jgi:hypothetical protein